jgi:hypothetical protein
MGNYRNKQKYVNWPLSDLVETIETLSFLVGKGPERDVGFEVAHEGWCTRKLLDRFKCESKVKTTKG